VNRRQEPPRLAAGGECVRRGSAASPVIFIPDLPARLLRAPRSVASPAYLSIGLTDSLPASTDTEHLVDFALERAVMHV